MRRPLFLWFTLICLFTLAQKPKQLNSAEIYQEIKKLNVVGNVLYLAAHPDDENTRFISYCANEKLYNTAYLSLTRGDGGQNLIGTEIREELGIIRTQELLAARRTDGGKQFFTRANDFGYSKTPEETFEIWDKEKILGDVVWVIRKFRPDVIVCRFPTDGGGGHGHHTASALLAKEAFGLAGDPTKYPEQLTQVDVWQPKRVVVNTGRWWNDSISADDPGVVAIDIGKYNQNLGISYNELAALSRSQHKSQGFGSTGKRGEQIEFFEHLIGQQANDDLFEGYASDWTRIEGGEIVAELINSLIENFNINNPTDSKEQLFELRNLLLQLGTTGNPFVFEKLADLDRLILQVAGVYVEAVADDFSGARGDSIEVTLEFISRADSSIHLRRIASISAMYQENFDGKNEQFRSFSFQIPRTLISQPYWLEKEGTIGTYFVKNQDLVGLPERSPSISFQGLLSNDLLINIPLVYKWNDPVKGEMYRPFVITPAVTANIDQPSYLFSDQTEQRVFVTLKSHTDNQQGYISIEAPDGWEVLYNGDFDLKNKGDETTIEAIVVPNDNPQNGSLQVNINGSPAKQLRTISYDHIPTQTWFPPSETSLVYVNVQTSNKKIGYLVGAGDLVPEALRNIGYQVDLLEESDLESDNLNQYGAILTGIRFFNVNERSPFMAPKLMEYVNQGGNLIVQYNTRHRMKTQDFGPYPIKLSRDRVTEEDAEVIFLAPEHSVLNTPNKITQEDFENWVQERGLYFPSEWDEKYTPILSWHDKGEPAREGSLLVTKYGKGNYVYTGISFFRELPAGVPGAYRLLVNLIELGNE